MSDNEPVDNVYISEEEIYNEDFVSMLGTFEDKRLIALKGFVFRTFLYFIVIPIFVILILLFIPSIHSVVMCAIPFILINLIILYFWYKNKKNKEFINLLKTKNKRNFLKNFKSIRWVVKDKYEESYSDIIPNYELEKSGLFFSFDNRYIDDEFEGTYKNVPFGISETELIKIVSNGKSSYPAPIFKGIIIKFKSNKEIRNRTIVSTKLNSTQKNNYVIKNILIFMIIIATLIAIFTSGYSGGRLVYHCIVSLIISIGVIVYINFCWKKPSEPLNKITLESVDFMKKFDVYSSDEIEARYLITPSFMERFQNLKTVFGSKVIKCSFYNDNIMIAIDTQKDFFEIGSLFKSFNDKTTIKRFLGEIESIYNMIDYFKLDENTKL